MQHVPGYKGHVHGVSPENVHGKSYARTTATAINKNNFGYNKGQAVSKTETFTSLNRREFSNDNFRRFLENPESHGAKDYNDYSKSLNDEHFDHKTKMIQRSNPRAIATICSKTGTDFFSARRTVRPSSLSMGQISVKPEEAELKPRLLETKVAHTEDFYSMSNGFQRVFSNDNQDKQMKLPISGYSGHQRGDKSQNYYGKSFRDTAIQSKRLERSLQR